MNDYPAKKRDTTWCLEICKANPLYNVAQNILETYHVKICALLIHIPTADNLADRKTLLQVVHNDGYILVSVLPLYAALTVLQKQGIMSPAEHISANVKISETFNYYGIMYVDSN